MIDFRFHLISLVAVFLALGLGVLMGTVVLPDELTEQLDRRVANLEESKQGLQEDVIALERQLDADVRFADVAEDWLLAGSLQDRNVILLRFGGTDDRITDGIRTSVETAGGDIAASLTFTDKLALSDQIARDQLALAVESTSGDAADIRRDAGEFIGDRLAAAALAGAKEGRTNPADNAASNLLDELSEGEFVEVDRTEEATGIPRGYFVLAGGSIEQRPFNLPDFAVTLAASVADRGAPVIVAESSESTWGLVEAIRSSAAQTEVSTVDHAETIAGRIAVVLGIDQTASGRPDHYGVGPGASEVIPRPSPED